MRTLTRLVLRIKRPWLRRRITTTTIEWVNGVPFVVFPPVHNPVVFRSGQFLADAISWLAQREPNSLGGGRALDLGTGSGVGAVFLARAGLEVVATDISEEAVRCAQVNVWLNRSEERVEVRKGDLFATVAGERFDLVTFNPPFFYGDPITPADRDWRSRDVIERFAQGLPNALRPSGLALVVFSSDGDVGRLLRALDAHALRADVGLVRDFGNEVMTAYVVRRESRP